MPQFVGLHINMISVIIDKGVYVYTFVFFVCWKRKCPIRAFARLLRWHRGGLPVIRMSEATVVYENGTRAVNKASLRVDEGEFVFLVGASGSGKTTIIKLLTGEVRPSEGRVIVNNYDIGRMKKRQIPYLRRTLGVVYQDFRLINTKTVYENCRICHAAPSVPRARPSSSACRMCSIWSAWPTRRTKSRDEVFPAVSSSVSQSRVRWSTTRASSSRTSRPATLILRVRWS